VVLVLKRKVINIQVKILVGVLSCLEATDGLYEMVKREGILKTWASKSYSDVEIVYFYGVPNREPEERDGNIFVNANDDYVNIIYKNIEFFRYILKHKEFDYLYRINASSYLDIENLKNFLKDKPKEKFVAGNLVPKWNYLDPNKNCFIAGCGFTLSRDVIESIINLIDSRPHFIHKLGIPGNEDDVIISLMIHELGIIFQNNVPRHDIWFSSDTGCNGLENMNEEDYKNKFLIRCKAWQSSPRDDHLIMQNVFEIKKKRSGFLT